MSKLFSNRRRALVFLVLFLILLTAAYGFAAGISGMPASIYAGEGETTVSGYAISNLTFSLDASDPRYFDQLSFNLDAAATTVYAGLGDGVNPINWVSCNAAVSPITCDISSILVQPAIQLYISAAQ